jgi:hypothetical protein
MSTKETENENSNIQLDSPVQTSGLSEPESSNKVEPSNTLTILDGPLNAKVYLVGTAHFSVESQKEVIDLIRNVRPNRVVLELCGSRVNLLKLDEATVLQEAREMNMTKVIQLIKKV